MELLAFRRGKVVTRSTLYDHLFAEEDQTLSNFLDVHVCNVRKKLGKDFIETHRGHRRMNARCLRPSNATGLKSREPGNS